MKEENPVDLLYYNEGPDWGMLPQVRPFSLLSVFFAVGAKAPVYQICKDLGTTPIPEGPEGQVTAGERSQLPPPIHTNPLSVFGKVANRKVCILALPYVLWHCIILNPRETLSSHRGNTAVLFRVPGSVVLSISHRRLLLGSQSGCPQQRTDRNRKTKCQRVKVRQDLGPGPMQITPQATQICSYG